jgi:hypothetical protein
MRFAHLSLEKDAPVRRDVWVDHHAALISKATRLGTQRDAI